MNKDIFTDGVAMMVLWELKEILKKLLEENQETIIVSDTKEVFAEDVIYEVERLFKSLKCDFKIEKILDGEYKVTLYN
jgi:phosphoribosyl-ATP pyrophosphohydrolase